MLIIVHLFRLLFIDHPQSVGENYFSHAYQAAFFGFKLIIYGGAEIIHALVPGVDLFELCGTKSYRELNKLTEQLQRRNLK